MFAGSDFYTTDTKMILTIFYSLIISSFQSFLLNSVHLMYTFDQYIVPEPVSNDGNYNFVQSTLQDT